VLLLPFRIYAVDQRFRATGVTDNDSTRFFRRRRCHAAIECLCMDLQQQQQRPPGSGPSNDLWWTKMVSNNRSTGASVPVCFYAVRYWNRPLFQSIFASSADAVPCGSIVAISHFGKPHPGAPWNFAHPKVTARPFVSRCTHAHRWSQHFSPNWFDPYFCLFPFSVLWWNLKKRKSTSSSETSSAISSAARNAPPPVVVACNGGSGRSCTTPSFRTATTVGPWSILSRKNVSRSRFAAKMRNEGGGVKNGSGGERWW
jgi:hypothetical protein